MSTSKSPQPWKILMDAVTVIQTTLADAEPKLQKLGIDHKLFFVLSVLNECPHPSDLADCLMLPRPTLTALIKRGEAAGLLRRESVPSDLRRFRLVATPAGQRVADKGRQLLDHAFGQRLKRLMPSDVAALQKILSTLGDGLDAN